MPVGENGQTAKWNYAQFRSFLREWVVFYRSSTDHGKMARTRYWRSTDEPIEPEFPLSLRMRLLGMAPKKPLRVDLRT